MKNIFLKLKILKNSLTKINIFFNYIVLSFTISWTIIDIINFIINIDEELKNYTINFMIIKSIIIFFGTLIALLIIIYLNLPEINHQIKIKDFSIKLIVGDIFHQESSTIIIPSNSTFNIDLNGVNGNKKSLQHILMTEHYTNIEDLKKNISQEIKSKKINKPANAGEIISIKSSDLKKEYLLMSANHIGQNGSVEANDVYLKDSIFYLFFDTLSKISFKDKIAIPLIGTQFGKTKLSRFQIFTHIVDSFINSAINKQKPCETLIIVIYHEDVKNNLIDILDCIEYMNYCSKFRKYDIQNSPQSTPIT